MTSGVVTRDASAIGRSQRRFEDHALLTGRGRYVGDVRLPDMLHLAVVRSDAPHASLRGIDLAESRRAPGVVDAFAISDLEGTMPPIPSRPPLSESLSRYAQRPLARERVRYVGEPIAVIVATDRYAAEDAAALVTVDYEFLPAIGTMRDSLAPDATLLFPESPNVAFSADFGVGEFERARAEADMIVTERFHVHRHTGMPLETRGLVADFDEKTRTVTMWGLTKMPHTHRRALAEMLGLAPEQVRCEQTHVGGGFGVRGEFYPEDFLVPLAAMRNRRPVQWIEDRREHLLATNHSREMDWEVRGAFAADGTILGFDAKLAVDIGAYIRTIGPLLALFAAEAFVGPYRVLHYEYTLQCVVTNKMGVGTVRSPGRYEATFVRERLIDIAAEQLGIDRVEIRRRNLTRPGELPSNMEMPADGIVPLDANGDHEATLDAALQALDASEVDELRADAHARGRSLGVGVACCSEASYTAGSESARVRRERDGAISVFTSATAMGQGHWTTFAQIASDALGIDPAEITVTEVKTNLVPEGEGTFGSRTMIMTGNAVWLAANELRRQIELPSFNPDAPCEVTREFRTDAAFVSHAASVAVVELDKDLGQVFLRRYVVAADVGRILNPVLARAQLAGAAVQGIGGALLEELAYSSEGQPLATTFEQYLLPTALDVPTVEVIVMDSAEPSSANPLGVRGAGEIGTTGAAAAVASAVGDALGTARSVTSLPLKPGATLALLADED